MKSIVTKTLVALVALGLFSLSAPDAQARPTNTGPHKVLVTTATPARHARVSLQSPRIHPAPVVIIRPPLLTFAEVYVPRLGHPHRVYVPGWTDRFGRYHRGYWTWTY